MAAKRKADEVEQFITNNKISINDNNTESIDSLLNIAKEGIYGINTNQPIYSTFTINNEKCIDTDKSSNGTLTTICDNSIAQKWIMDVYGRIRNMEDKCMNINHNINIDRNNIIYNSCNISREQIFIPMYGVNNKVILQGHGIYYPNKNLYMDASSYSNKLSTSIKKSNNDNQLITNFKEDKSFFWLLKPESRKILENILEKKNSKQ